MKGVVEEIFVTGEGSAAMERVGEVRTIEGCGIEGTATVRERGSGRVMETFAR